MAAMSSGTYKLAQDVSLRVLCQLAALSVNACAFDWIVKDYLEKAHVLR